MVQDFPIQSSLDPEEFGDPSSAIEEHHIEGRLEGLTVDEVMNLVDFTESRLVAPLRTTG